MFDCINFKMACPTCGEEMHGFQSKDADCTMERIEPDAVNNFYASCQKCKTWVEFTRNDARPKPSRPVPLTEAEVLALGFRREVHASPDRGAEHG